MIIPNQETKILQVKLNYKIWLKAFLSSRILLLYTSVRPAPFTKCALKGIFSRITIYTSTVNNLPFNGT